MEVSKSPMNSLMHVPMKFFATLDSDRTPRNCVPRLCSFTITRLIVKNRFLPNIKYVFIAVKINGSKKTLRSDEIRVPPEGTVRTRLQLSISLQYLHNLKSKNNKLSISLQVRNRYKRRRMPGFKCLAKGFINMDYILQMPRDETLQLTRSAKKFKQIVYTVAEVELINVSSQPISYYEENNFSGDHVDIFSEDEELESGNDILTESEQTLNCIRMQRKETPYRRHGLKKKIMSLISRFRRSDVALKKRKGHKSHYVITKKISVDFLNEKFGRKSASESDDDSVTSIPKPQLKPYFQECGFDKCQNENFSIARILKESKL